MGAEPVSAIGRVLRRVFNPVVRVWLFIGLLGGLALALYLGAVTELPIPRSPFLLPWWAVAAAFYLVEIKVVHLQFRRGAHSFSLSEVPVVVGLFLASPGDLVIGHALAGGLALFVHRRQQFVKLAFNVATFALCTGVAVVVFDGLSDGTGIGPTQWAAAIAAVAVSNIIGMSAVTLAISISEGRPRYAKFMQMAAISTIVALTNASLALLAVTLLLVDLRSIWLLAIPIATLFFGYRSYLTERQQHETLELLYESSRVIQRSPELDSALVALLEHTRVMFRAERAEIRLYPQSEDGDILRTAVGPGTTVEVMKPDDRRETDWLRSHLPAEGKAFVVASSADDEEDRYQGAPPDLRGAMVAPLRNDAGPIGIMLVANRFGEVTSFTADDCRLFETVANHAATALENGQLERSLAQLSTLKEELRFQVHHDPLTGLANRTLFIERVEEQMRQAGGELPVVLFVDVDDFKIVNDRFGHATGDALVVMIAERIRGCLRSDDLAARLGGDEFGVLLLDDVKGSRALKVADRIIDALRASFVVGGKELRVGASIGIAAGHGAVAGAQDLLRNADVAMYTAKSRGKSQFAVFEPKMQHSMIERHVLSADLHRAVGRTEFLLRFQPVISLGSGQTVGGEALIRWKHPIRGVVSPSDFMAVAEESDVILPIGRWVLVEACREAQRWERADGPAPWVSVNLSARQVQQISFVDEVAAALDLTGLPADRLVLEVTETLMMNDLDGTAEKLATLKRMGVRIAVDDFGTGYSALSYLRRFPVDMIKIARDFVDVAEDADWAFAHAIISLGQTLGLQIVAEGVEHAAQADRLRLMGCDSAQGYFFARPLQPGAMARRIIEETAAPTDERGPIPLRLASASDRLGA